VTRSRVSFLLACCILLIAALPAWSAPAAADANGDQLSALTDRLEASKTEALGWWLPYKMQLDHYMNEPTGLALCILLATLVGTVVGAFFCLIPSLHIYNVAGISVMIWIVIKGLVPFAMLAPFFMGMIVAFAYVNTIPMTFFNAADESAGATLLPSNDLMARGRGWDASILSGIGTMAGTMVLIVLTPLAYFVLTYVHEIIGPHTHWILGLIMVFYVMSEWPKGAGRGKTPWTKFKDAWRNVFAGMFTFTLAAVTGCILLTKPLVPVEDAFQAIMPVFVGFFAFPSTIQALFNQSAPARQYLSKYVNGDLKEVGYATVPGTIAGLMCALFPGITMGIACIFSGHMTNHRALRALSFEKPVEPGTYIRLHTPEMYYKQEAVFILGGGITKILYYVGAFLFVFVLTALTPTGMGRGGLNIMLRPVFSPEPGDYFIMLAVILISSCLSLLALISCTRWVIRILPRLNMNLVFILPTILMLILIYWLGGGWVGLGIAAVTTCIGCIPVFYASRRSHTMAFLLVPIALNMAGYGDALARWMHLV